jgi:hypothetical protein
MRFSNSNRRRSSRSQQESNRPRLAVEPLEDRRMLAAFELSSLLAANGGDGTAGFVANGPTTGSGFTVSLSGDMNGDGYADFLVSDVDFDPFVNPGKPSFKYQRTEGAVFVVFGNEQGIPGDVDLTSLDGTNGFAIYGNPEDGSNFIGTGWGALAAGDLNGDGFDDAVIPTLRSTRAYVLYGKPQWGAVVELQSLTPSHGGDGSQGFVINGPVEGFPQSIALDGDVNYDGRSDLVIGSYSINNGNGGAFVIYGRDDQPFPVEFSLNSLDGSNGVIIHGIDSGEFPSFSGNSVSAGGDLNGDGVDDIVIGARRASPDAERLEAGQVFVVYGSASLPGTIALSDILNGSGAGGFVLNGIRGNTESGVAGDRAGVSVHSGGDFNGDGISDLAIGASRARNEAGATEVGESYIVFGRSAEELPYPAVFELADLDGTSGVTVRGFDEGDSFGKRVALANFNGDAYADLVLTAPGGDPDGRTDAGEVFVVFGSPDTPAGGLIDLAGIIAGDGSAGLVIRGIDAGEAVGGGISAINDQGTTLGVGDINGDGVDDLALGSVRTVSRAYVVFGGADIIPPPPAPSFSIDDVTVTEGDSGTMTATFTITRAGDTSQSVSVKYETADITAAAGADYTALEVNTLTFAPGVTTQQIVVTILSDTLDEGDETFAVNLIVASVGTTIADGIGVATIVDDDAAINPNTLYVYDIRFESKRNGKDWRAIFEIRSDSNADGVGTSSDSPAAGVLVTVTFAGQTYTGVTDSSGVFRTNWLPNLSRGNHYAEAVDLALAGFVWDPLSLLNREDDSDNDGLPDQLLSVA